MCDQVYELYRLKETDRIIMLCKKHLGSDFPIYKANKDEDNFGLIINQIE